MSNHQRKTQRHWINLSFLHNFSSVSFAMSSTKNNKRNTRKGTSAVDAAPATEQQQHPLDTAILYSSPTAIECAHTIPLQQAVSQFVHNNNSSSSSNACCCPICNKPVTYIEDGCVRKKDYDTTALKIGKLHVRLSVPPLSVWKGNNTHWQQHKSLLPATATTISWWNPFSWLMWQQQQQQQQYQQDLEFGTAQARIAHVLQLQHLKILSKGKVLYPLPPVSSSSSSSSSQSTTKMPIKTKTAVSQSQKISQQLLEDSTTNKSSRKKTSWLLVMGTTGAAAAAVANPASAKANATKSTAAAAASFYQAFIEIARHCLIWTLNVVGGAVAKAGQWLRLTAPPPPPTA